MTRPPEVDARVPTLQSVYGGKSKERSSFVSFQMPTLFSRVTSRDDDGNAVEEKLEKRPENKKRTLKIDPRTFNDVYLPLFEKKQQLVHVFGGGSSGKSFALTAFFVSRAFMGEAVLCARQTQVSIGKSLWKEFKKTVKAYGLNSLFRFSKSDYEIRCPASGGSIQFVGCDDVEKLKSITPVYQRAFSKVWVEEATEVSRESLTQLRIRMRGKSRFRKQTFYSYNPIYKSHHLYKDYFDPIGWTESDREFESDDLYILKTTYKDNRFLGREEVSYLESLKFSSPYFYDVYALGNFGVLGTRVYDNWEKREFDPMKLNLPRRNGLDFGFVADPTAVLFCAYDKANGVIYVYDEIYRKGLTNKLVSLAVKQKLNQWGIPTHGVWCDSAEPKSINELKNRGVNARKTAKGSDSVLKGIDWLRQHKIIVHPRCKNLIEELNLYIWVEKDGEIINTPVDRHNHALDALRYAFNNEWKASGKLIGRKVKI